MRHLRILPPLSALILVAGCSAPAQRSQDQSILEVVDSAEKAVEQQGCNAGEVNYCVTSPGEVKRCSCVDSREVTQAYGSHFAR